MKSEALAFRIWQYAAPREWNVTLAEIADHLGESWHRVRNVVTLKRWNNRIRLTTTWGADGEYSGSAWAVVKSQSRRAAGQVVAADLAAGRIGNGESI